MAEPIRAKRVPWDGLAVRWAQRRPARAAILVATGLAVAAFAVGPNWTQFQGKVESTVEAGGRAMPPVSKDDRRQDVEQLEAKCKAIEQMIHPPPWQHPVNDAEIQRQLEAVLAFSEALVKRWPDDLRIKLRRFWAVAHLGRIEVGLWDPTVALPRMERAVQLGSEFRPEEVPSGDFYEQWAYSHMRLARMKSIQGDPDAVGHAELAHRLWEARCPSELDDPIDRRLANPANRVLPFVLHQFGREEEGRARFLAYLADFEARPEKAGEWGFLQDLAPEVAVFGEQPRFRRALVDAIGRNPECEAARSFLIVQMENALYTRDDEAKRHAAAEIVRLSGKPIEWPARPETLPDLGDSRITLCRAQADCVLGEASLALKQNDRAATYLASALRKLGHCFREHQQNSPSRQLLGRTLLGLAQAHTPPGGRLRDLAEICEEWMGNPPSPLLPGSKRTAWTDIIAGSLALHAQYLRKNISDEAAGAVLEEARRILDSPDPDSSNRAEHWAAVSEVATQEFKLRVQHEPANSESLIALLREARTAADRAWSLERRNPLYSGLIEERSRRMFRHAIGAGMFNWAQDAMQFRELRAEGNPTILRAMAEDYRKLAKEIGEGETESLRNLRNFSLVRAVELTASTAR
ncbi:MAG: hypothetical protein U0800_03715 [Isosphaeraceae bacterium]